MENQGKTTWKKGQAPQSTSNFPHRQSILSTNAQKPGSVNSTKRDKTPWEVLTSLEHSLQVSLHVPKEAFPESKALKKKSFFKQLLHRFTAKQKNMTTTSQH